MENDFVVDNSVVMAWCFDDESSTFADAAQELLIENTAYVPSIWPLEVANVLLVAERKDRISRADSGRFIALLTQLPIVVERTNSETVFHDIMSLARSYMLSSYDASYLELAIRKGLPFVSLDKDLIRAAKDLKVQIIKT